MRFLLCLLMVFLVLTSFRCVKSLTDYYPDPTNPSRAMFSDKGYNLMTAVINQRSWKTTDRYYGFIQPFHAELDIYLDNSSPSSDTLHIGWQGAFEGFNSLSNGDVVELVMPVAKGFTPRDLNTFSGKRLDIQGSTGYFRTTLSGLANNLPGTGHVYFSTFHYDPSLDSKSILAGLMDADFGSFKLEAGRFDHQLNSLIVHFP